MASRYPVKGLWCPAWSRLVVWSVLVAVAPVGVVASVPSSESSLLADLPPEVEEALGSGELPKDPRALLDAVFEAAPPFRFEGGPLAVRTDRRWFATVPGNEAGSPLLELRRWPGDTVLALYALDGPVPTEGDPRPVPGGKLEMREPPGPGTWLWEGTLGSPTGSQTVLWVERTVPEARARIGALLVPGDAGLGSTATRGLTDELLAVLDRVEVDPAAWGARKGLARGVPIAPPRLESLAAEGDERLDAWQIVEGAEYTLGVPPGIRARRLDLGIGAPRVIPGAFLWMRGRFVDRDGGWVVIGDGRRFGYAAESTAAEEPEGPLGAPGARLVAREPFHSADTVRTGADISAERWNEPGFAGEWLVFRLRFERREVEIGLPVLAGGESLALFWMPLTWRAGHAAPAPPPIDPAERFGIDFDRFSRLRQKREPWTEGYLRVPGLRLDVPKDWWPSATLRSGNGFPVRLVDGSGKTAGWLKLLPKDSPGLEAPDANEWVAVRRRSPYRAAAAYRRADGARLYVTHEGYGFLLEPDRGAPVERQVWERMAESALVLSPQP